MRIGFWAAAALVRSFVTLELIKMLARMSKYIDWSYCCHYIVLCCISISILSIYRRISKLISIRFYELMHSSTVKYRFWRGIARRFHKTIHGNLCVEKVQFRFYGKTLINRIVSTPQSFSSFAFLLCFCECVFVKSKHVKACHTFSFPFRQLLTYWPDECVSLHRVRHIWFASAFVKKSDCSSLSHHLFPCAIVAVNKVQL